MILIFFSILLISLLIPYVQLGTTNKKKKKNWSFYFKKQNIETYLTYVASLLYLEQSIFNL